MSGAYSINNQTDLYYLTLTVQQWADVFSRKRYRDIVIEALQYCIHTKGLKLYAYVIMTNHLHLIAQANEGFELSNIIRDFKKHTAKQILKSIKDEPESRRDWLLNIFKKDENIHEFWQKDNHAFSLYSVEMIQQKLNYIHKNSVRAGIVREAHEYIYSSASSFSSQADALIKTAPM